MNNISGIVKSARKIMRQDTGTGRACRIILPADFTIPEMVFILFLSFFFLLITQN
jgi:hypothetical protein